MLLTQDFLERVTFGKVQSVRAIKMSRFYQLDINKRARDIFITHRKRLEGKERRRRSIEVQVLLLIRAALVTLLLILLSHGEEAIAWILWKR